MSTSGIRFLKAGFIFFEVPRKPFIICILSAVSRSVKASFKLLIFEESKPRFITLPAGNDLGLTTSIKTPDSLS